MRRALPWVCICLGLLPLALWAAGAALGWGPDAQVLSGTLDPAAPEASALRGVVLIGAWMLAATFGPPLVGGGGAWLLWRWVRP